MKQGPYWTDPANQAVWGWVERYHVGIGGWGDNMRVRVEDRKEAWELVPERTCTDKANHFRDFECSECADRWTDFSPNTFHYCPNCGARVVE